MIKVTGLRHPAINLEFSMIQILSPPKVGGETADRNTR